MLIDYKLPGVFLGKEGCAIMSFYKKHRYATGTSKRNSILEVFFKSEWNGVNTSNSSAFKSSAVCSHMVALVLRSLKIFINKFNV